MKQLLFLLILSTFFNCGKEKKSQDEKDILIKRNAIYVLTTFIWRYHLLDILGIQKHKKYVDNISTNEFISYSLLNYKEISDEDRRRIYCIIKKCAFYRWKFYIKEKVRYLMRNRK